jgi:hypothetical protein
VHPRLEVGQTHRPVGHPGPALVETDQAAHRAEPVEEVGVPRVVPVDVEVRHEAGDEHDVAVAAARDLVRDVEAVAHGVADRSSGRPGGCARRRCRRVGDRRRRTDRPHVGDEPVTAPVDRPDHSLLVTVVRQCPADLLDPAGDCRVADEPVVPHGIHQLFLADHTVAVVDEMAQHVERLRLERDDDPCAPQLEQLRVELDAAVEQHHHDDSVARRRHGGAGTRRCHAVATSMVTGTPRVMTS